MIAAPAMRPSWAFAVRPPDDELGMGCRGCTSDVPEPGMAQKVRLPTATVSMLLKAAQRRRVAVSSWVRTLRASTKV